MGAGESKIEGIDILPVLFRIQTEDDYALEPAGAVGSAVKS